jgi:CTP:molybdopterin cytidylyltransferase MocA
VIAAVVLAAGASSRYGADPPKQAVLLPRVLAALAAAASLDDVVVVAGAFPVAAGGTRVVHCDDWERGAGASLRCGLAALGDADAAVVVLADGPDLDPRAVDRVVGSWRQEGGPVVAASYGGVRLHPVVLAREAWERVPDEGARSLEARLVACDDLTPPGDVDTREG